MGFLPMYSEREEAMRKIGPLAALIALVVVLALGFAGYALLGSQHEEPSKDSEQLEQPEQSGQADDSEQSSDEDPIMLADYDARVYTEQGDMIALSEIADGKPLVINFWATWCPYCVQELPDFQEIHRVYADRVSFAFVDVTDGTREITENVVAWLSENGFDDLPVYYDIDLEAATMYGARSLPMTVLVSADGEILGVSVGMIDPVLLRDTLDSLV